MNKYIKLFCIILIICTSFTGIVYATSKYTTINVQKNSKMIYINGDKANMQKCK